MYSTTFRGYFKSESSYDSEIYNIIATLDAWKWGFGIVTTLLFQNLNLFLGFDTLRILKNPFELVKFRYARIVFKVVALTLTQSILLNILSDASHTKEYEAFNFCYLQRHEATYVEDTCVQDF